MWMTGRVVDDRGRALSGVTVEASGPAAVNRRAVVSNAQGQYVVQDLRPGAYTVTFARPGFFTVQRNIVASWTFVATINAQLKTGHV